MESKVSIIIVNYTSGEYLFKCLQSIQESVTGNYEVIIVDNDSQDDSFIRCKPLFQSENFVFVEAGGNIGFAKANNMGFKYASGDIIHFLNPDTILYSTINSDYATAISSPDKIYINQLVNPDGSIAGKPHLLPTLSFYLKALLGSKWNWYIGASVIISRENFEKIGQWNEGYFMYSEDMDLFYKAAQNRILSVELPSQILHIGGGCSGNVWSNRKKNKNKDKAFRLFFEYNNIQWQYPIIKLLISGRMFLKYGLHKLIRR